MSFFSHLNTIDNFRDISLESRYCDAPGDWLIVIADIVGSTRAVKAGHYKQVNMAAGCIVTAILNSQGDRDIPFVFGGDGATLLVPGSTRDAVSHALLTTRNMIRREFDLDMRVGLVPVTDILTRGKQVKVARLQLSEGNCIGLFSGGGIELAETLVKSDTGAQSYLLNDLPVVEPPDLHGLSCRWEPLHSCQGVMLCLLVKPMDPDAAARASIMDRVLTRITGVLEGSIENATPVRAENMRFRWPPKGLLSEARATRGRRPLLWRTLEVCASSLLQLVLERFDLQAGHYNAPQYRHALRLNSDYCRYDDTLRMVLDCSAEQVAGIESLLNELKRNGLIEFGLHSSDQALMTCLVSDLAQGQHLHFIDGDEGGFWAAAMALKSSRDKPGEPVPGKPR